MYLSLCLKRYKPEKYNQDLLIFKIKFSSHFLPWTVLFRLEPQVKQQNEIALIQIISVLYEISLLHVKGWKKWQKLLILMIEQALAQLMFSE